MTDTTHYDTCSECVYAICGEVCCLTEEEYYRPCKHHEEVKESKREINFEAVETD